MKNTDSNLIIDLRDDYNIKFESVEDFDSSFFNEIYERAADNVNQIIQKNLESEEQKKSIYLNGSSYNNVISFVGDRGTGKSSSMISFCHALLSKNDNTTFFDSYPSLKKMDFISMGIVDPSLFHKDDNLFEIIISKMFAQFQDYLVQNTRNSNDDLKGELIDQFQKVYDNLRTVHRKDDLYQGEALDELANLAFGTNLRANFQKLLRCFIKFMGDQKEGALLIVIDDFDLNVHGAYRMLEDVRMYLMTENVIIFIACKIDQLLSSLEEEIRGGFKHILNSRNSNLHELPKVTAENYLEKLIPADRRMYLPELKQFFKTSNQIIQILDKNKSESYSSVSIESIVFASIYENTKLFIRKPQYDVHPVTPRKLRSLVNAMKLYSNLQATPAGIDKLTKYFLDEDIFKLKEFDLFDQSISDTKHDIRTPYFQFFADFNSYLPDNLNQRIIEFLDENEFLKDIDLDLLVDSKNEPLNVSIGDLIEVLNSIEKGLKHYDNYEKMFLSGVKTFYNAYMLKLIFQEDSSSIQKLFGGSILCEKYNTYLPEGRDEFNFSMANVIVLYKSNQITYDDLLWLFMFVTHIDKKPDDYRTSDQVYYTKAVSDQGNRKTQNATFSFMDFIANSLNPDSIASRIEVHFHEGTVSTLLQKLKIWNSNGGKQYALMHNLEFLTELVDKVSKYSTGYKDALPRDYSGKLKIYLGSRMQRAMKEIVDEGGYSYLELDPSLFASHPIMNYWDDNSDRIDLMLNELRSSDIRMSEEVEEVPLEKFLEENIGDKLDFPKKQVEDYLWTIKNYLKKKDLINMHTGVRRMSTIRLKKFDKYPSIHIELTKLKLITDHNVVPGLVKTRAYLEELLKNG